MDNFTFLVEYSISTSSIVKMCEAHNTTIFIFAVLVLSFSLTHRVKVVDSNAIQSTYRREYIRTIYSKGIQPIREFCHSFIDDLSVCSDEWAQHLDHLKRYLTVNQDAGLVLHIKSLRLQNQSQIRRSHYRFGKTLSRPGQTFSCD